MSHHYVSAVFDTRSEAEHAVSELRSAGIDDGAISLITQRDGKHSATNGAGEDNDLDGNQGFLGKAALGAGVGTALGVAALAIPGVGPLVAAGAIASAAIPAAAVTGAAVGLAAGSLASVFADRGVDDLDAEYYQSHIGKGGIFVSVDTSSAPVETMAAQEILYRAGGHSGSRTRLSHPA